MGKLKVPNRMEVLNGEGFSPRLQRPSINESWFPAFNGPTRGLRIINPKWQVLHMRVAFMGDACVCYGKGGLGSVFFPINLSNCGEGASHEVWSLVEQDSLSRREVHNLLELDDYAWVVVFGYSPLTTWGWSLVWLGGCPLLSMFVSFSLSLFGGVAHLIGSASPPCECVF